MNVFITFLDLLGVKHTDTFSDQYFNEHPNKYNLFGLSKMLSDYGVNSAAIQIPDKENDITEIETPFIAQFGGDFVAVSKVDSEKVSFIWNGANHELPAKKFSGSWTGVVLLAETTEQSIEPDYKEHRKAEIISLSKRIALFSVCGIIMVYAYIYNLYYTNAGIHARREARRPYFRRALPARFP